MKKKSRIKPLNFVPSIPEFRKSAGAGEKGTKGKSRELHFQTNGLQERVKDPVFKNRNFQEQ